MTTPLSQQNKNTEPNAGARLTSEITVNFLLCSERSGSNLIRVILDAHSQIHAPGPIHLGRIMIPKLSQYGDLNQDKNFRCLAEDIEKVFNSKYSHYTYSITADEIMANVERRHFCAVYEYIYKKGMLLHRKKQVFIKENHNHRFVSYWRQYFTNAKFIFQVRDPRDYYLSAKKYRPFLTQYHSPTRTINTWKNDQEQSLKILKQLGSKNVHLQRYEDLIENPEKALQQLCKFLDLPYEARMLEFHKGEAVKIDAENRSEGWGNLTKAVMQNNKEKFRSGLSKTEITNVEHRLSSLLVTFNYKSTYKKIPVLLFIQTLIVETLREFLANIYRVSRDSYRRARDIVNRIKFELIQFMQINIKKANK